MAWELTFSPIHMKCAFLEKAVGIQDIEVVLENWVHDLDLITLSEKAQIMLTMRARKERG